MKVLSWLLIVPFTVFGYAKSNSLDFAISLYSQQKFLESADVGYRLQNRDGYRLAMLAYEQAFKRIKKIEDLKPIQIGMKNVANATKKLSITDSLTYTTGAMYLFYDYFPQLTFATVDYKIFAKKYIEILNLAEKAARLAPSDAYNRFDVSVVCASLNKYKLMISFSYVRSTYKCDVSEQYKRIFELEPHKLIWRMNYSEALFDDYSDDSFNEAKRQLLYVSSQVSNDPENIRMIEMAKERLARFATPKKILQQPKL